MKDRPYCTYPIGRAAITYVPSPKTKTLGDGFPGAYRTKPKTPRQNGGGLRDRWKDDNGTIYEWDYQHGNVEAYDKRGKHQGDYSYTAGMKIGNAINTRTIEP